jgi:hypothetical protein
MRFWRWAMVALHSIVIIAQNPVAAASAGSCVGFG